MKNWLSVLLVLTLSVVLYADVQVHFKIEEPHEWDRLLQPPGPYQSYIRGMTLLEWEEYWLDWQTPLEGEPYPQTEFLEPELYVAPCDGGGGAGGCMDDDPDAGLVMTWGEPTMPNKEYASAWVFEYGLDPDLSNSTIKIAVEAPCGMTQISLGLQDMAGNIRSWYWNVAPPGMPGGPGLLPCSPDAMGNPVRVNIQIDLSQIGVMAATPQAASYMDPGPLDITQVQQILFDENMNWVAGAVPPPPGQTDPKPWNYWFDLSIIPNGANAYKGNYVKYSQPPVERDEGLIYGWDVVSLYNPETWIGPVVADDWLCTDRRPVTDLHWWGSFKGWSGRRLPSTLPRAFHIGIWKDVPASADGSIPSHPGVLVWQHVCDKWVWNFAGYDLDPRCQDPDWPCELEEACFQFNQLLSEPEWFWQDPLDGQQVYWISIAAMYEPGIQPQFPWGWKTRPHIFNDDAVRITDFGGPLPWQEDVTTVNGFNEIQFPAGVSWDMAFELTTNERPRCHVLDTDLNHDCIVNLVDLSILARDWLVTTSP